MLKQAIFAIVKLLHDLFTVIWVGGMITLGNTVLPAAKQALGRGSQMKDFMDAFQARLSKLVYVSIAGLIVTGVLLSNRAPAFGGLFRFGNAYTTILTLKHVLVGLMIAIALFRSLALRRRRGPSASNQENLSVGLLFLNIALGVLVLLFSGFSASLSTGPSN